MCRELTVVRSWTFTPEDIELVFYIDAGFILGLMMGVENRLDRDGARAVTVTSYAETYAVDRDQVATCWFEPATERETETVEGRDVSNDWRAVLSDPRWHSHESRLAFAYVTDDPHGPVSGASQLEWFVEFSARLTNR